MPALAPLELHALSREDPRVIDPILTMREAAVYLEVSASTFQTWARGYSRSRGERLPTLARPVVSALPAPGGGRSIPFIGLVEGYVLRAFRKSGVPLQRIRPALDRLAEEIGVPHALASRHLYTDRCEVLYDYAARAGDDVVRSLTVVRSGQNVFPALVEPYLEMVTWDHEDWPKSLRLPAFRSTAVVVDPTRSFGRPILEVEGTRVEDILDRFLGGDGVSEVAEDFGVSLRECEDVIRVAVAKAA
jgi:uncharacterized protein (DUF433 family)